MQRCRHMHAHSILLHAEKEGEQVRRGQLTHLTPTQKKWEPASLMQMQQNSATMNQHITTRGRRTVCKKIIEMAFASLPPTQ